MIYLTNDAMDQAVYLDLRRSRPHHERGEKEELVYGLLGNGVNEVTVTVKNRRDGAEVILGRGELFNFVEERVIRRMIGELFRETAFH
jgi:hypothetical protein